MCWHLGTPMTMRTPGRTTTPPLKPPRNKKLPEKQPVMTNEHETMTTTTKQDEQSCLPERGEPERQERDEKRARASRDRIRGHNNENEAAAATEKRKGGEYTG